MQPSIPKPKDIAALKKKLLDQINKQYEPTPQDKYDQEIFNRTWNPETMSAERLREFQSHGWFLGYEPRESNSKNIISSQKQTSSTRSPRQ